MIYGIWCYVLLYMYIQVQVCLPHFERFQDSQMQTSDPRHIIDQRSNILSSLDLEILFSSN